MSSLWWEQMSSKLGMEGVMDAESDDKENDGLASVSGMNAKETDLQVATDSQS